MDNNLPPNDDNQQPNNLNPNPPEPSVIPPAKEEEEEEEEEEENKIPVPSMPEIPETPTEKPEENLPQPEPTPEETKPEIEEKPIEIGSLGEASFTSYSQENTEKTQDDSQNQTKPKAKKVKTMASVMGILLIALSLPLSLLLVKQNQEIRKEAAKSPSGSVTHCGVTVSKSGDGSFNGSSFTGSYSIKNNSSKAVQMELHLYACACNEGTDEDCGTSRGDCTSSKPSFTIQNGETKTVSITTHSKDNCGRFQTDAFVMSCKQL